MYGDINGGVRRRGAVGAADFYRHVPKDMMEATKIGVAMSIISIILMSILFICETFAFVSTKTVSSIGIDSNTDQMIMLNFNITLYDLHCDFVAVDVWDTLGTNLQNVTKDIMKWNLDMHGQKKAFAGRNSKQRVISHETHSDTILDLAQSELRVVDLDPHRISAFQMEHNGRAMIDFFAPWCVWCQRLEPTWEKFARRVLEDKINLGVGKVDCVAHAQLCKDEHIVAFPTLRWYENGKAVLPDYRGDRTVEALIDYSKQRMGTNEGKNELESNEEHYPGCLVVGHIMVNRVPGNFHIEARSSNHDFHSAMTNLTHRVNDLTFGQPNGPPAHLPHLQSFFYSVPERFKRINPMKNKYYPTYEFHQAFHHHLKVISTHVKYFFSQSRIFYQILEHSHLVLYDTVNVPEIRFSFDLSPISVNIIQEGMRWYDYITSLCAIIGGTYTTLGLINAGLLRILKPKKL